MKRPPNIPNFFILGAAKCGTTALNGLLDRHPSIYMSNLKEPLFFEAEYKKGLKYYTEKYFSTWANEEVIGEARHRNLYLPYVAARIQESIPNPKFIVIVRNPVDRAYSHWWHWRSRGLETLTFEDAIGEDLERIERGVTFEGPDAPAIWKELLDFQTGKSEFRTYVDCGYYARQLRRYLELFPEASLKVILLEDMISDRKAALRGLCSFLGVPPLDEVEAAHASLPRNAASSRAAHLVGGVVRMSRVLRYLFLRDGDPTVSFLNRIGARPPMHPDTRESLLVHYGDHNQALSDILGRDVSHWNT